MSKYVELAKKLYELSSKGEAGEADNALKKLNALMKAHGITMKLLEYSAKEIHEFKVPVKLRWLFIQMVSTLGEELFEIYISKTRANLLYIECTFAEKVEIEAKFDFYKKAFGKDFKAFKSAFIQKNRLFPQKDKHIPDDALSPQEDKDWEAIALIASGLNKHDFHKQIGEQ